MDTIKNLHDVCAFYFFVIAFALAAAALAWRSGLAPDLSLLVLRIMDVPFAMVALGYGASSLFLQLQGHDQQTHTRWATVIVAVSVLLFLGVVIVNFGLQSVIL